MPISRSCQETCVGRNVRTFQLSLAALAAVLFLAAPTFAAQAQEPAQQPATEAGPGTGIPDGQTTLPPPSEGEGQGAAAPLRVMVGKSLLINTTERLKRVSVTDEKIVDAIPLTPTQILVHGRAAGEVSLLIWDELERSRSFDLRVDVDVTTAAEEEKRIFPNEQINVSPSRSAIVLSGHVSTEDIAKRAGMIAEAYSSKVVNVLTFGPVGAQEVLLEVKFAEVDRSAVLQLGANLFAPGIGNTVALSQTGQFGSLRVTDTAPTGTTPGTTTTTISDFLNLYVARTDINFGAVIRALQQKNLLQILAEPNLIAVNGKEASFLAGGEFPFPVVQPGNGFTSVSIQFKEFGVRLRFTPEIMPSGNIHLKVVPEVSNLDFANGLSISGFNIPALSTRRAETEFELQDGQSFAIAGLMDNRVTSLNNKIPWLGDIPIIGNFFKSKNVQKSKTELVVMCTVKKISASNKAPAPPNYPVPFLDKEKFDGKKSPDSGK
jgi:pilus assembly protein CpaC